MPYGTIAADYVQSSTASTPPVFRDANSAEVGQLCRAWVNFVGTGSSGSATINASFNVSSVTVNGTGDFTINFTNAFVDANYCMTQGVLENNTGNWGLIMIMKSGGTRTASAVQITTKVGGNATLQPDAARAFVTFFR